jgi:hypothetical protein
MNTYCVTLVAKSYHRTYVEAVDENEAIAKADAEFCLNLSDPDDTDADWYVDTMVKDPAYADPDPYAGSEGAGGKQG